MTVNLTQILLFRCKIKYKSWLSVVVSTNSFNIESWPASGNFSRTFLWGFSTVHALCSLLWVFKITCLINPVPHTDTGIDQSLIHHSSLYTHILTCRELWSVPPSSINPLQPPYFTVCQRNGDESCQGQNLDWQLHVVILHALIKLTERFKDIFKRYEGNCWERKKTVPLWEDLQQQRLKRERITAGGSVFMRFF